MRINNISLCLKCMSVLNDDRECPKCHFEQTRYTPPPRCLRPATMLADRYAVGCVIGEGSFGITYIGWDSLLELRVAIKEFFPSNMVSRDTIRGENNEVYVYSDIDNDEYRESIEKFYEEAKTLSQFNECEGIVSVRDFFYANNTAYMVMNYVEGKSLKEVIHNDGKMSASYVLDTIRPILDSLKDVHSTGLVHRDISPDNILVGNEGKLVLIDFGSARIRNVEIYRDLTVTYKRGYSPEEQYRADGIQGPWSDIYAICATMYYMMTGEMPVEAVKRLISDNIMTENRLAGTDISKEQAAAIYKGMAVNAGNRYQNIDSLINDLYVESSVNVNNDVPVNNTRVKVKEHIYKLRLMFIFLIILSIGAYVIVRAGIGSGTGKSRTDSDNIQIAHTDIPQTEYSGTVAETEPTTEPAFEPTETPAPATYVMASFKNKTKNEVKEIINSYEDDMLKVSYRKMYNDKVKKGHVIKQSISKGAECQPGVGKELILYISKGPKPVKVPSVTGMDYNAAILKLNKSNIKTDIRWIYSDKTKGTVVDQSIVAGSSVDKNSSVTLTVSKGSSSSDKTDNKSTNKTDKKTDKKTDDDEFVGEIL